MVAPATGVLAVMLRVPLIVKGLLMDAVDGAVTVRVVGVVGRLLTVTLTMLLVALV